MYGPDNPSVFPSGIRVFFVGAWLFCADPTSPKTSMLAITRSLAGTQHTFPYGPWRTFNPSSSLQPNPAAAGATRSAYTLTVDKCTTGYSDVDTLFADSAKNFSFTYFPNPQSHKINFATAGIRVISLPFPSRIVTADFAPGSTIASSDPTQLVFTPGACDAAGDKCGLAAAHIFDYQGASVLSMDGVTQISGGTDGSGTTGPQADFHFHTVPQQVQKGHAEKMVHNLLQLLNGFDDSQITVSFPETMVKAWEGPYVPTCVQDPELAIPAQITRTMNTASCAGGGGGVGGNGN